MFLSGHGLKPISFMSAIIREIVMVSAPLNDKTNPVSKCSAFATNPENSRLVFSGCK